MRRSFFKILLERGISEEEALQVLSQRARDNGRTPMQWTGGEKAGFSTVEPWIGIPDNHSFINVETEEKDPDSILHYYRDLVRFRKQYPIIAEGGIRFLETGNQAVLAYERTLGKEILTVVCNFSCSPQDTAVVVPKGRKLIGNYPDGPASDAADPLSLRPYEAFAILS